MGSHGVILRVTKGVKTGVKLKLIASLHLVIAAYRVTCLRLKTRCLSLLVYTNIRIFDALKIEIWRVEVGVSLEYFIISYINCTMFTPRTRFDYSLIIFGGVTPRAFCC